ncbi:MAG: acetolactate synthase large subunit [Halothiobacillaceae bacterium]
MRAAELFLRCLENEGVRYLFGVPGEENLDLMDALHDSSIEFVMTRHEQGAAFMADLVGRLTHRPGVCLSTLGPGATNLVTGVADANMDNAPLVAIAGQAGTDRLHKESHQVLDLVRMFEPITGYASRVLSPLTIPETVRKAFKSATSGKGSASFIELPENIAEMEIAADGPLAIEHSAVAEPADGAVERAAGIISAAKSPIILVGHGVIRGRATRALSEFATRLNIPVANTFMAKGAIPFRHAMALGSVGLQSRDYVSVGFDHADVIICVGYDMVEYHPRLWHPSRDRCIVHVDSVPAEVDAHYGVDTEVVGDIGLSLARIAERAIAHEGPALRNLRRALIEDMNRHAEDRQLPIKPQKLIWDLRTVLSSSDIVISDVGAHKMWLARMYRSEEPNTCIISNGFASMGIALPGAVAAKLLYPQKTIVAATGDAGFLMNVQELETAVRMKTAMIVLVWNDGGYGLIELKQRRQFGRTSGVHFGNPDFVQLARSFGARGYRLKDGDGLQDLLREAISTNEVCVIDVPVDYSENAHLTARLGEMVAPA